MGPSLHLKRFEVLSPARAGAPSLQQTLRNETGPLLGDGVGATAHERVFCTIPEAQQWRRMLAPWANTH
eukprot:7631143-Pyramimonas_sp.AAC.1